MNNRKKKQLITTADCNLIDKNADGFILAEEYLDRIDVRGIIQDRFVIIPDNLDYYEQVKDGEYLSDLSCKWTGIIIQKINEILEIDLSRYDAVYLINQFVLPFLQELYAKYRKYKYIENEDFVLITHENDVTVFSMSSFRVLAGHDVEFHSQIWARICEYFGKPVIYKTVDNEEMRCFSKLIKRIQLLIINPYEFFLRLRRVTNHNSKNQIIDNYERFDVTEKEIASPTILVRSRMPIEFEKYFESKSKGYIKCLSGREIKETFDVLMKDSFVNTGLRETIFGGMVERANDEFEKLFSTLLPQFFPISFLEKLPVLLETAKTISLKWKASKIYHSNYYNDLFNAIISQKKNRNKEILICDIQHAQTYGGNFMVGTNEFNISDRFLTWGWTFDMKYHAVIRPVAMSRLPQKNRYAPRPRKKKKILIASSRDLLLGTYDFGFSYGRYIKNQKRFIDALPNKIRRHLVVRINMFDDTSDLRMWCQKKYPYIKFELLNDKTFSESLAESELLICDYYGSPHMEALILDHPFVMFDGIDNIKPNPACVPFLEKMKNLGIYREDAAELAEELANHENFSEWLNSKEIKTLLTEYKNYMTNADKDVKELWYNELMFGE